jgi:hypothetical protein
MNQTRLTCFGLIASACALAAALFINLNDKNLLPSAEAEMVLSQTNLSFLTTRTQANEECLFVIDNTTSKLLIYKLDNNRKRLELVGLEDLAKLFKTK